MPETTLTWLGHATFRFDTPSGKRIYIDPFLNGNPKCPESELEPEQIDVIALTHGHGDHLGDTVELAKKHGCTVIAPVEMADWLQGKQGVENVLDPNKAARSRPPASSSRSRTRTTRARTTTSRTWESPSASSPQSRTARKLNFPATPAS